MTIRRILKTASGLIGMCLLLGVLSAQAAVFTVTTTTDAGAGSLRQAMTDAINNGAANTIGFNIPIADPGYSAATNRFTISLLTALPDVPLAPLTIGNAQTQAVTVKGNNTFRIFTLADSAVFTVNNLTVSNGFSSGSGGAIFMGMSSTLNLNRSTVSSSAAVNGGAIYINNSGTLNIDSSTVSGNTATTGGGIFNNTSGTINAVNSTIDGNTASGNGGGIYNIATINLTSNTVSGNSAAKGGGIYNDFTATLINNLVALNIAADGSNLLGRDSLGNAYTGTYNLIGNADGSEGLNGATNRAGSTASPIDTRIGVLQNNGGATFTRALMSGSPAIDSGTSPAVTTDQRGQTRPYDNALVPNATDGADIGAFEANLAPTAAGVSVAGQIITPTGFRITFTMVTLIDPQGNSRTILAGKSGRFLFTDVPAGATYIISVTSKRYTFAPQAITVMADLTDLIFTPLL